MSLPDYLDSLFEPPGDTADGAHSARDGPQVVEWERLVEEWERQHGTSYDAGPSTFPRNDVQRAPTPWPSLLDYYHPTSTSPPHKPSPSDHPSPLLNGSRGASSAGGQVSPTLVGRVRNYLTVASTYNALIFLLTSTRTNEDIQSELVEILGFEGQGLQLVEELLQPGAREVFEEDGGKSGTATTSGKHSKKGSTALKSHNYLPSARLTVTAARGKDKKQIIDISDVIGTNEDIERRIQEQLERPKAMFSEDGPRLMEQEVLPNVYTAAGSATAAMSQGGRFALPQGTVREISDIFEEVTVPPTKPIPQKRGERAVRIADLPPLAKGCFPNYITLNRMQSLVQPTAMSTNENLLIAAPTGAGKTDIAIMAIIRVMAHHLHPGPSTHPSGFSVNRDAFKIIYVAPMKALAAEITRKFGKRLAWLGMRVRELTGDMQLTRQEIAETQIIVTTPEKWDVVTRKPTGEGELASKVKLLIIDEVHLLNEERGAVIETIVARTLRQVESSQSLIRIVGLSATLPNYVDVSDFLRVNRYQGLFFFDSSFRPVPLEQHFIGVAGKPRSQASIRNTDRVVFDKVVSNRFPSAQRADTGDKVSELVRDGHQVMVFVHARKETVKTAQRIKEMAMEEGMVDAFDTREHPRFEFYRRDIATSRNKEMKELFDSGFGIHHAGMLRTDRNMMERMFEDNAIKVLCCTSTLAWGVNLPAHAVVIKGTSVYDRSRGAFVDLSVLDVLQIFGRAGRPGYETSGVGYICTTQDKLEHYLYNIMAQHPIESKFIPGMVDSLNAEVSLGTIANVQEAIQWLGYTYLFVRMRKEPFIYGMPHDEPKDDPQLGNKRNQLITQSARQLAAAKMIRFDEVASTFVISDLGRIAAKYYLKYQTMEIFNTMFHPKMKNADLFAMLAQATEFDQIQIRENEIDELTAILDSDHCPMEVKGGTTDKLGKVNILLQAHISKVVIEDFALVSDTAYVAQNSARIIRALLQIALSRSWANNAILLIDLSKAIEHRLWPYEHPLAQVTTLHRDTIHNLRQWADNTEIAELREMDPKAVGDLVHTNERHGTALREAALMFPTIGISYALRPLSHDLLQISVQVKPLFTWNAKLSGSAEPFYLWIQDEEGLSILQWRSILLRQTTTALDIDFVIPMRDSMSPSFSIISASDRWLGSDTQTHIPLDTLVMPQQPPDETPLLDIPYLHISCFDDTQLDKSYRAYIITLNSIQSRAFWTFYHTQNNVLISAPIASGKSLLGEAAIWHAFRHDPDASVMVIVPHRQSVTETVARIRSICPRAKGIAVQSLISSSEFDSFATAKRMIAVTTPSACLRIDDSAMVQHVNRLALFVLEDLHLFDDQYEIAVARILSMARPARTRIVGITSSLNDPSDLADWLGVGAQSRFFFHPRDRGNPVVVSLKTFTIAHSSTLLKVMVKPAYDILKSATDGAILFVPSRAACRTVAADLITQSGTEMDLDGFLAAPRDDVEPMVQRLRDPSLFEPVLHGIGFILPGMAPNDLSTVLELFASGILRALIVPREACWTLPVRAEAVVVMGAQYIQTTGGQDRGDRQVVNYSRQELVKMQGFAVRSAHQTSTGGRLFIMCQSEQATAISRVFNDGLPLESSLPALIRRQSSHEAISALAGILKHRQPPPPPQLSRPRVPDLRKRDMMDMIGWTYLAHRIKSNPTYYDMHRGTEGEELSRLVDEWFKGLPDEYGPISVASSVSGSRTGSKMGSKKGSKTDSVAMSRDGSSSSGKRMVHGHATRAGDISDGMEMDKQVDGKAAVAEADGEPFGSTRGSCGMRSVPRGDLG